MTTNATADDEAQIRALIERRADALRHKSASETMATQSPDYVQYPLSGVLEFAGPTQMAEADFAAVFGGFVGPVGYESRDLHLTVGDRVAVSRSLSHISATLTTGGQVAMWFRKTLVFVKTDSVWEITHEHESVPIAPDGSGAAATGLEPA